MITGLVTDPSGAALPGANITVTSMATNTPTSTTSNEEGNYTVPFLQPGQYTVTAEASGFKRLMQQNVEVRVGDRVSLDLQLEAGGVEETITVTGETTPLLNTASATAGQVIDRRRVSELPLADGNPVTLVRLAPGVALTGTAFSSGSALSNSGPSSFRVNGAPAGSNEFSLDGSPNTADPSGEGLRIGLQPPTDAVQEFKVVTASFDASQGHTTGGSVDFAIRSGQNRVFGTLYEFVRNDALAANGFFLNRSPFELDENGKSKRESRRYNRYGGTVGGPIVLPRFGEGGPAVYNGRDKSFFFVSYEGIRTVTPSFETLTLPTAQQRLGDFSNLPAGQFVYDPATARQTGARIVRTPIQCNGRVNVICPERISPIARSYLSLLPPTNLPGTEGNFSGNGRPFNTYYVFVTRVDHSFNDRHKVFVRYSESDRAEIDENSLGINNGVRANGRFGTRANRGGVIDYVWTVTPTTIFNLRAGYTRFIQDRFALADFDTSAGALGFPPSTTAFFVGGSLPQLNISGFSAPSEPTGFFTANRTPSVQPTLTKVAGNHTLRFGYDFRVYQENRIEQEFKTGIYNFNNEFTRVNDQNPSIPADVNRAQSLAAFLLGQPTGGSLPRNIARASQSLYHGIFFQDDWKATRNLTLNLGLRYEYDEPTTERYNRNTRGFDFTTPSPVEAAARAAYAAAYATNPSISPITPDNFRVRGGLLFVDENNRGFFDGDKNNFQPRLGFAYKLDDKTVLRGGFAIYTLPAILDGINAPTFAASTPFIATANTGLSFIGSLADPFP
ncbi:MAG: TonB-dependent receptor, partial [Acidobacteriota bacterium]|nr:TonB-dependent receptor [Acidobacteriota bacterium]